MFSLSFSVCVLYFDNNTNDPSLDVLRKGIADMLVPVHFWTKRV